jgi:hypothetical protein
VTFLNFRIHFELHRVMKNTKMYLQLTALRVTFFVFKQVTIFSTQYTTDMLASDNLLYLSGCPPSTLQSC